MVPTLWQSGGPITLASDRERSEAGHDLWYSGKHRRHGGNIQVLTDPTGYPVWVSDVEPGSVHDITAARLGGVRPGVSQFTIGGSRQTPIRT